MVKPVFFLSFISFFSFIFPEKGDLKESCLNIYNSEITASLDRIFFLEARYLNPVAISFYTDRCQLIKSICFQDLTTFSPKKQFRYNWMTRQKQVKTFSLDEKSTSHYLKEKSKHSADFGRSKSSSPLPILLDEYENKLPMIWFLKSESSLRNLISLLRENMDRFGIKPIKTNKLLIVLEEDMTSDIFFKNPHKGVSSFLSEYFSLVSEPEEVKELLKKHSNATSRLEKIESEDKDYQILHESFFEKFGSSIYSFFKKLSFNKTLIAGASYYLFYVLNTLKKFTSEDSGEFSWISVASGIRTFLSDLEKVQSQNREMLRQATMHNFQASRSSREKRAKKKKKENDPFDLQNSFGTCPNFSPSAAASSAFPVVESEGESDDQVSDVDSV